MAGAKLFAYPSLYEGFGLPVLEAMACGVPVVCSNASTLPEVAGSAAALHDPDNVDALVDLLAKGLTDEGWRTKASAAGLAQAAGFSWQRCTQETMNVYKAIAQG
ncbi:glycosyltransferase [Neopusillimonas aromaticivorans]|uniref:glycosyltransferase n=1 Tax=Neopusillimonas aromaticivorans TaxID=2979868 RepID=UPI0025978ABE|nr:glycosyltransferase [Neopusillimonas aromaticivorans]WJJ94744.1 glycosyltransferase [Neopusillimonas aromaticivorans]